MNKYFWVLILLAIGQIICSVVTFTGSRNLKHSKDSYQEKYEVAISERDYYKRLSEWKSGFDVDANLADGMSVSIRVNYQDDYTMSAKERLRLTMAMKEAMIYDGSID